MATTGTPPPAFEHDPLPEHTSHFRLLHIIRGDFGQHVECEVSAWPIDNAPPYYAISYTWGDSADTTEITVNGRPMIVRRNCEYVLQQAFASKTSKYFWVDAICIAQTTAEKNHQVGIMGQIYSGAKHVLACVGPHENESEFLLETIKEYRSLLTKICGVQRSQLSIWFNPIEEHNTLLFRCLLSMKSRTRQRLYQSFCSFMRRPYFKRLWVIQELHLARSVSYCFGDAVETAKDFLALYELLNIWNRNHLYSSSPYQLVNQLAFFVRHTVAYCRTKTSQALQELFSGIRAPASLLRFACTAKKQNVKDILIDPDIECSDPRDRLFGVLSVIDRPPQDVPKPNYTKDRFEVALDALKLVFDPYDETNKYSYARKLCGTFQISGEEASLRGALNLRSNKPTTNAISNHSVPRTIDGIISEGLEISGTSEDLTLPGPTDDESCRTHVSAREQQEYCVLTVKSGPNTMRLLAPLGTKRGDWWLRTYGLKVDGFPFTGFIVRPSKSVIYDVIGLTCPFDDKFPQQSLSLNTEDYFRGHWHPEDLLLFGWTLRELLLQGTTQDQRIEFVNRRLCAWEGSSYFRKIGQPNFQSLVYSSDSSVPL